MLLLAGKILLLSIGAIRISTSIILFVLTTKISVLTVHLHYTFQFDDRGLYSSNFNILYAL